MTVVPKCPLFGGSTVFDEISRFLCDCDRNKEVANLARAEYIREHLEHIILTVTRLHTLVQDYVCDNPVCEPTSYSAEKLITLEEQLSVDLSHWQEKVDLVSVPMDEVDSPPTIHRDHQRGRPPFNVDTEQIIYLRDVGFTWKEISTMLG